MGSLAELMCECWADRPASRHTAYKIKKELIRLISSGVSFILEIFRNFCGQLTLEIRFLITYALDFVIW
jgi:hypothetical protein